MISRNLTHMRELARGERNMLPDTARPSVGQVSRDSSGNIPLLMNPLSSLFSAASRKHSPAHLEHGHDRVGYLLAGGAGIVQAIRARGFHKLLGLALAGSMLYKGLKGHGHGPVLAHARAHGHGHGHGLKRFGLGRR